MSTKQPPIRMICTFCGWNQVIRLRHTHLASPKCEQCGCDEMLNKPVGVFEELVSWVKSLIMR